MKKKASKANSKVSDGIVVDSSYSSWKDKVFSNHTYGSQQLEMAYRNSAYGWNKMNDNAIGDVQDEREGVVCHHAANND